MLTGSQVESLDAIRKHLAEMCEIATMVNARILADRLPLRPLILPDAGLLVMDIEHRIFEFDLERSKAAAGMAVAA